MKKSFFPALLILSLAFSCCQVKTDIEADKLAENKRIALLYHDLNPEDMDEIFTEDFMGRGENHDWDLESHRNYLSSDRYMVDSIIQQIAEGDWVATWLTRTLDYQGERLSVPIMHFKRFEDGKIAELWEFYDYDFSDETDE